MPERQIAKRGGAIRYRTIKSGGKTFKVAVVRKRGPRGGKTVAWEAGTARRGKR